jgi:uncharacterized membrane protein
MPQQVELRRSLSALNIFLICVIALVGVYVEHVKSTTEARRQSQHTPRG